VKYLACIARAAAVAGAVLFGYLAFWPVPIEPDAWTPGPDPGQTGPYVANDDLALRATLLSVGAAPGESAPETIARSPRDGRLYTALANGAVIRLPDGTGAAEAVAQVGPRPLGVVFAPDGTLYVAHTSRGILRLAADGTSATVAECGEGRYPRFTDSLYVAADGAVWFTCPSQRFDLSGVRLDAMESGGTGRVRRWDPTTGETSTVLDGLLFANGITMSPDETFLLVNEWAGYRVLRYWVKGPRAGEREAFIDDLPGYPDNIHRDADGLYWVGMVVRRNPLVDRLHSSPTLMKILPRIPEGLQPHAPRFGWLIALDGDGRVRHNLQDSTGAFDQVTGALHVGDELFVSSNTMQAVGRLRAPGDVP